MMNRHTARRTGFNAAMARCVLASSLLALGMHAAAQTSSNVGRWYQVEVILFEQRAESDVNEVWETYPLLDRLDQAVSLRQPADDNQVSAPLPATNLNPKAEIPRRWPLVNLESGEEEPFVVLPRPLLQLTGEARRLHESRGRRVLLHTGWNMPVADQANTDFIRLHAGERIGNHHLVDGTLGIYVGRFLHVQAELNQTRYEFSQEPLPLFFDENSLPRSLNDDFTQRQTPMQSLEERSPTFRMGPRQVPVESAHFQENRRMRSNELHYIDHPRLGLLIQFTPYEQMQISPEGGFQEGGLTPEADDM